MRCVLPASVLRPCLRLQNPTRPCVCAGDDSTRALVERVMRDRGRLDALVNNAYGGVAAIADHFGKRFWEKPLSQWDASHDVGLRSHYIASCLAVPNMLSSGGLIVNISSGGQCEAARRCVMLRGRTEQQLAMR